MLGERAKDIRGMNKAAEEEDLVEVKDKLFVIIMECPDTTSGSV